MREALHNLEPEEQQIVQNLAQKINLEDPIAIMQYGSAIQNKIAQISDSVLQSVRTNQMSRADKSLSDLVMEIKSFVAIVTKERKGLLGKPDNSKRRTEKILANYPKVEANINKIQTELEAHQRQLIKDIHKLNLLYDKNQVYFKELTMFIIAGEERFAKFCNQEVAVQRQKVESTGDEPETQKLNNMLQLANRFEKKLHDLKLSRTVSMQMAPQIRLLQNNDGILLEKIQSSIVSSIPLWKNQMILAIGSANSHVALATQNQVVDVAKCNNSLITTINEVLQLHERGRQDRTQAETELLVLKSKGEAI